VVAQLLGWWVRHVSVDTPFPNREDLVVNLELGPKEHGRNHACSLFFDGDLMF
jgi:hypothetical protein